MKAAVVPAVSSSWQIKDVPQPQPGPGQVLVKMHASGICYTDVHQTLGHLPGQFPRILGHEPVGEIVAVAPDVTTRMIPSSKRILLDLTDVTQMDSTGLGTLVRLYVSAKSAGCALQLFNIGKPIRQLLGATRLLSVFEVIGNSNIRCG